MTDITNNCLKYKIISNLIKEKAQLLCLDDDSALIEFLQNHSKITIVTTEKQLPQKILSHLNSYGDLTFDYAFLSKELLGTSEDISALLPELLRISSYIIISFEAFKNKELQQFRKSCKALEIFTLREIFFGKKIIFSRNSLLNFCARFFAKNVIYLLTKNEYATAAQEEFVFNILPNKKNQTAPALARSSL